VLEDAPAMEDMLRVAGGRRQVPVLVEGDQVAIGFGGS